MDTTKLTYDATTQILTYRSEVSGQTLLPKAAGRALSEIARAGVYEERPVSRVVVLFGDDAAASYNSDAMSFLQLGCAGPSGEAASGAKFSIREDFGIKPV